MPRWSITSPGSGGIIIIDNTPNTYLYLVLGNNQVMRDGVGAGRGVHLGGRRAHHPHEGMADWFPPKEMIGRQPYLPRFMAGGDTIRSGARAMYLGIRRSHPLRQLQLSTIGTFVSSGCIRLTNDDVEDLFSRVTVGTRVVVLPGSAPASASAQNTVTR